MRLEKMRKLMTEAGLDGFLVTQPENRRYLSGFTGSSGVLIISRDRQALATDSRYYEQVRQQCPDWELVEAGYNFTGQMLGLLREFGLGGSRTGFEAGHLTVTNLHQWERAIQGRLVLVHTEKFVEELRIQKDETELRSLKKAIALADSAVVHITNWMQPGMTEVQIAWELETFMRTRGAEALSFDTIVASGPNAAKPHAGVTNRVVQAGEPVTMDFGCIIDGYCSDITRTVCLGEPADEQYLKVWHTVLQAQTAAIKGATGGMAGKDVDQLARDVIKAAGYGDYFGHGLGHSLGLAVHEIPNYSFTYSGDVPAGAVMTVEPGIYISGWGGVRLEDVVVVNDKGVEVLTTAPKEAVIPLK